MLYELTPERKKLLEEVCGDIIDLLYKRTAGPAEAIIALSFVRETLEETSGLKMESTFTVNDDEKKQ